MHTDTYTIISAREVTLIRLKVAMINFVIVAALGVLLRYYFFQPFTGFVYPYTLHAHSHLAFLGWVFMALYAFILYAFLPDELVRARKYTVLFIIFQIANIGMLVSFPFTGYALWSIIFSSIHAVASMVFAVIFILDGKKYLRPGLRNAFAFVKWALILMFISNFGPFSLGPIMAKGLGQTDTYYLAIYYYLHFQYNGWFTFAVIGLLLWYLQQKGVNLDVPLVRKAFQFKLAAIVPAYVLSALWTEPSTVWYIIGGAAGALQLVGALLILGFLYSHREKVFSKTAPMAGLLLLSGLIAMTLQHLLQFMSAIPVLGDFAFANRSIVIAYLHMVLIGFITAWLLFFYLKENFMKHSRLTSSAMGLFIGGFLISELVLLFQPLITDSPLVLFALAVVQLVGIAVFIIQMK